MRQSNDSSSTPGVQAVASPVTCADCVYFLSLPRRRRSLCRWSGEHVNGDWLCSGCWGFQPLNGGGAA